MKDIEKKKLFERCGWWSFYLMPAQVSCLHDLIPKVSAIVENRIIYGQARTDQRSTACQWGV